MTDQMNAPKAGLDMSRQIELPGGYLAAPTEDNSGWCIEDTMLNEYIDLSIEALERLLEESADG